MIKNAIIYRIGAAWSADLAVLGEQLAKAEFAPCSATQQKSVGWVPPRGHAHGAFVEAVGAQWIARFMVETKAVPTAVIGSVVDAKKAAIEQQTGRRPGKKETRDLLDDAIQELLPQAFPRQAAATVWIDPAARLLVIDAASQAKADDVVTTLIDQVEGLTLTRLQTRQSAAAGMTLWLDTNEPPAGFSIDRECELKATDDSKAAVRYSKHPLDIVEISAHIEAGKIPTKLALMWTDRMSFVLTDTLQLRKISFLEAALIGQPAEGLDDGFDAGVAIATGELGQVISELIEALGGEEVQS